MQRTISSNGGSIWSIAVNPSSSRVALGCEDGSIQLLSLENDSLFHLRRLDRSKSRVLSLAWGPATPRTSSNTAPASDSDESDDEGSDAWTDSWLVAGCSDSSLRRYDLASGQILERMGTDKVRGERTLVWTVGVLGYVYPLGLRITKSLTTVKRRHDRFGRLHGNGQVLGLSNGYADAELPIPWSRRVMPCHRSGQ